MADLHRCAVCRVCGVPAAETVERWSGVTAVAEADHEVLAQRHDLVGRGRTFKDNCRRRFVSTAHKHPWIYDCFLDFLVSERRVEFSLAIDSVSRRKDGRNFTAYPRKTDRRHGFGARGGKFQTEYRALFGED